VGFESVQGGDKLQPHAVRVCVLTLLKPLTHTCTQLFFNSQRASAKKSTTSHWQFVKYTFYK